MKLNIIVFGIAGLLFALPAVGQDAPPLESPYQVFATINGNILMPVKNAEKGIYPILGYDKKAASKVEIGGFGVGLSAYRKISDRVSIKGQFNISRHAYWNTPIELKDQFNQSLGTFESNSSSYTTGVALTGHYFLKPRFSVGTGFGAQLIMLTMTRTPSQSLPKGSLTVDHDYKLLIPVIPVEISYKLEKMLFNIRYEYGLVNSYKHDLKFYKKDQIGLLTFEIGYRL